ncbi:MAG: hypothetical protein K8R85_10415, partial [Bacteroidetes bacterium]|nr:hypothetical protein [Bacteroidota bacterium]
MKKLLIFFLHILIKDLSLAHSKSNTFKKVKLNLRFAAFAILFFSSIVWKDNGGVAFGQAPKLMSYQAVIRNASNNLIANTFVGIR